MTPGLTTHPLPPRTRHDRNHLWSVRFEGKLIGHIEAKKIGRGSTRLYERSVLVHGRAISLALDPNFESRYEAILGAWRDPASNVHTRHALGEPNST